jgi:hypothetical protein
VAQWHDTTTRSYKVGCKTTPTEGWTYNALRFASREDAKRWGYDLSFRRTALRAYEVHESEDEPNYAIRDGQLVRLDPLTTEGG